MKVATSTATRRSFLAKLAAGSAVAVALPMVEGPVSIVAAKDIPDPQSFSSYFAAGTLMEVASDHIGIHAPGYLPGLLRINLTPQTEVCARGSCAADWTTLKLGDRIESATVDGPDGVRQATWVNANMIASMGTISAIAGNVITVTALMPNGPVRAITVDQGTTLHMEDGTSVIGQIGGLQVGDGLHFTAMVDDPNLFAQDIKGWTLHRLVKENA